MQSQQRLFSQNQSSDSQSHTNYQSVYHNTVGTNIVGTAEIRYDKCLVM